MATYVADRMFQWIFMNATLGEGPIDNKSWLIQEMAWRRMGNKPLPEPIMTRFTDAYLRHSYSLS